MHVRFSFRLFSQFGRRIFGEPIFASVLIFLVRFVAWWHTHSSRILKDIEHKLLGVTSGSLAPVLPNVGQGSTAGQPTNESGHPALERGDYCGASRCCFLNTSRYLPRRCWHLAAAYRLIAGSLRWWVNTTLARLATDYVAKTICAVRLQCHLAPWSPLAEIEGFVQHRDQTLASGDVVFETISLHREDRRNRQNLVGYGNKVRTGQHLFPSHDGRNTTVSGIRFTLDSALEVLLLLGFTALGPVLTPVGFRAQPGGLL